MAGSRSARPGRQPEPGVTTAPGLVLASASPRRRALLSCVLREFEVCPSAVDESVLDGEGAEQCARRLALCKARQVAGRKPGRWVLGVDTVVTIDGRLLGKPRDPVMACAMLEQLSGREHQVVSALALFAPDARLAQGVSISRVRFEDLSRDWIDAYVASGEPMDKAGGYAIQGAAGERIAELEGSYTGVMGLPLATAARLLHVAGLGAAEAVLCLHAHDAGTSILE